MNVNSPFQPLDRTKIDQVLTQTKINPARASIREMVIIVGQIEKMCGIKFLRMEFGIPGLEPNRVAIQAEREILESPKIVATYPPVTGVPELKEAGSKFVQKFLNLEIPFTYIVPTVGSMQGGFISQSVVGRRDPNKKRIAFVDPCFSVHRMQCKFLGLEEASVDLYERKTWLDRLEAVCKEGNISGVLYSSPNNPAWVILSEAEMKHLGEICNRYDVVAIEDSAYLGMDFRKDYSQPGKPPYPPTIARYTDNYVLLLSASKIFSYAGQRVALACVSPKLAEKEFPGLEKYFGYRRFLDAFVMSGVYCTTSGVAVVPQHGLTALLNAASEGKLDFVNQAREYAERAHFLRKTLMSNGFHLVYGEDLGEPLSDGFYFTFAYPGLNGGELVKELLRYGISATTLVIARSERSEAVRGCVSMIPKEDFPTFEERVRAFRRDH